SDELRLGLGAAPRGVVALEREENDEAEEDGQPRCEHAEHAGGAVTVLEVAPLRGSAADEQHRRDRKRRDDQDDERCPEEAHDVISGNPERVSTGGGSAATGSS